MVNGKSIRRMTSNDVRAITNTMIGITLYKIDASVLYVFLG